MSLQSGDQLGTYEILSSLGAGGMGEVFRARDSKLGREVAIKVLPEDVASDPDRLARFEREARALAALNHNNVATLFAFEEDGGTHFLSMEIVEGDTLEDRIARGPIPIDEALELFLAIASGLEAAHAKGIVHRDLKPANIKVGGSHSSTSGGGSGGTSASGVKILDFGLAKALAVEDGAAAPELSQSPTLTLAATMRGEILGTAAYMSPEQAQGEPADARADIWAFGVCLLEALSGKQVFEGTNHSLVLASVLKDEPDLEALPAGTPAVLRRVLRRCLEKDRDRRLRDIGDVRLELEEAVGAPAEGPDSAAAVVASPLGRWTWIGLAVGLAAGIGIGALGLVDLLPSEQEEKGLERFVVSGPPNEPAGRSPGTGVAIDHAGETLVYFTGSFPSGRLWVRRLDRLEGQVLEGSEDGGFPFLSPDGQWVGFFSGEGLKKVSILGGTPVTLCEVDGFPGGASWGDNGRIVFADDAGVKSVAEAGGEPEMLVAVEGESLPYYPDVLPGGEAMLFVDFTTNSDETGDIVAQSLTTGERIVVATGATQPRYLTSGHVVFAVDGTLRAVPFDAGSLEVRGDPVPVIEGVVTTGSAAAKYAVSRDGSIAYVAGAQQRAENTLVWVGRDGTQEAIAAPPREYVYPRLSPDGSKIALDVREGEQDIWVWDVERETLTRLTFTPGIEAGPVWSADGQRVYFGSEQENGGWDVFARLADGTGELERITESPGVDAPVSVTPDGRNVLIVRGETSRGPFNLVQVDTDSRDETVLLEAEFNLANAEISPDGRWMSYESDESGASQIFVRPFPDLERGRWQVSTTGGTRAGWSRDGSEIFFIDETQQLNGASVAPSGDAVSFGRPRSLTEEGFYLNPRTGRTWDVSVDGQRFIRIVPPESASDGVQGQVVLIQNWFDEVSRLAPLRN